jgi:AcrR family transcriptional regulator
LPRLSAQDRRREIVAATLALMEREGPEAASTRRIAAEAGVTLSTLHYCFGDKEALLEAVIEDIAHQVAAAAAERLQPGAGLADTIAGGIRSFWAWAEETADLQTLQYELTCLALRRPNAHALAEHQYDRYVAAAREIFEAGAAAGGEESAIPIDELARFVVAALDGLILQHLAHRDAARSRRDVEHVIAAAIALAAPRVGGPASDIKELA